MFQPGTFGFRSGHGCEVCNCARASYGTDCDKITGQCHCREGVTGRRCDHCEQGYWNYQSTGCTSMCKTAIVEFEFAYSY